MFKYRFSSASDVSMDDMSLTTMLDTGVIDVGCMGVTDVACMGVTDVGCMDVSIGPPPMGIGGGGMSTEGLTVSGISCCTWSMPSVDSAASPLAMGSSQSMGSKVMGL